MNFIRFFVTVLVIFSSSVVFAAGEYQLGFMQSVVVRTAILSDTVDEYCNADNTKKRWHMSEYLFKWKWKTTLQQYLDHVGKTAMGMTGLAIKNMIVKEVKTNIQNYGGCKTKNFKIWAKEMNDNFYESYDLLAVNEPPY